jgi:hypothetical protein
MGTALFLLLSPLALLLMVACVVIEGPVLVAIYAVKKRKGILL